MTRKLVYASPSKLIMKKSSKSILNAMQNGSKERKIPKKDKALEKKFSSQRLNNNSSKKLISKQDDLVKVIPQKYFETAIETINEER